MVGETISHYRILRHLGSGGMGDVYLAENLRLGLKVALKFLPAELARDPGALRRFEAEARAAAELSHPNIAGIHDFDQADGRRFLVLEYLEGETLRERIARGPLPIDEVVRIGTAVADALAHAHAQGIVHRDVKSANVMVTNDGAVKILDFGLARHLDATHVTRTGAIMGTTSYMSPEQASGVETDHRSDIFSLGVLLYELITARLPFRGTQPATIVHSILHDHPEPITAHRVGVPEPLLGVVDTALQKDPLDRYQSASALRDHLDALTAGSTVTGPTPMPGPTRARSGSSRVRRAALVGTAGIVLAIAIFVVWRHDPKPSTSPALAVMDFRDLEPDDSTFSAALGGLLHVGLVESSPIRIVSPEYLYDLRRRLFGARRGPIGDDQVLEVARRSGATMLLAGQTSGSREDRYTAWRLVDTRSGGNVAARRVDGADPAGIADRIIADLLPVIARENSLEIPSSPPSVGELTTSDPDAYRHYVAGSLAFEEDRLADAVHELEHAIALDSTFALARFDLAQAHWGAGGIEQARTLAESAWELRGRLGIKDRLRLEAFRHEAHFRAVDAVSTGREMLARWPDDREALHSLHRILARFWYNVEVERIDQTGSSLYPDDPVFARADPRTFVQRNPDDQEGWLSLGDHYLVAGLPDSAEIAFGRALDVDPTGVRQQARVAAVAYSRGDMAGARDVLERVLRRTDLLAGDRRVLLTGTRFGPGQALIDAEAGQLERAMGRFEDARRSIRDVDSEIRLERERNYLLLRMGRAKEVLDWARSLPARSDSPYARIAGIRWQAFALAALDSLAAAGALVPELRSAEETWGDYALFVADKLAAGIALAEGDPEEALSVLNGMSARGVPAGGLIDIEYREALARAYRMAGRPDEAIEVLHEILRVYGGHALSRYELGQVLEEVERPRDAIQEYERFLAMWSGADDGVPQVADARRRLEHLREDPGIQ